MIILEQDDLDNIPVDTSNVLFEFALMKFH